MKRMLTSWKSALVVPVALFVGFGGAAWGQEGVVERSETLKAEGFRECTRDRFVEFATREQALQLAPTYLMSDNMARSSKIVDELEEGQSAKKTFDLYSPCREVEVLFYAGWNKHASPTLVEVNGNALTHTRDESKMLTGGWDRFMVPGRYLHKGRNEIVFHGPCSLWVDADAPAGHSAKRLEPDGYWKNEALGSNDDLEGEYVIRIRVRGYPEKGTLTSPIVDVGKILLEGEDRSVSPAVEMSGLHLSAKSQKPPGTSIRFEIRAGSTPDGHPGNWTPWFPVSDPGKISNQRFIQWRATLETGNMNRTPRLEEVTLKGKGKTVGANRGHLKALVAPDNEVARSSYEFTYADPHHPRMRHLREKYNLEKIAEPGKNDAEKMFLISQWVREQWEGWDMGKYDYCPQWDALEVLELAPAGLGLGMCTHYAATFVQCAAALGYTARSVIVDHHCLAEAWSDHYGKWVFVDTGLVAKVPKAFMYKAGDGTPVNALELHDRYLKGSAADIRVVPDPPFSQEEWWKRYLNLYCRFGIPLRNDHLYNPLPQELEHGHAQYHWDGYLWWTDELDPRYPEYSLLANRPEDFYWTLNKTLVHVRDTGQAGVLEVCLHGPIPNLDHFLIRKDRGDWIQCEKRFDWNLVAGKNEIEARAVNTMGIECPVNRIVLEYAP